MELISYTLRIEKKTTKIWWDSNSQPFLLQTSLLPLNYFQVDHMVELKVCSALIHYSKHILRIFETFV